MSAERMPLEQPRWDMPWDPSVTRIMVVGVGRGGCSCVGHMSRHNVPGVQYLMVNTHIKSLEPIVHGADVISIRPKVLSRTGPGGDTNIEELSLEESADQLRDALRDTQLVFISAGMGGSTGTRAAPYIANLARELGAFVVGVVTTPFSFEGSRRIGEAITGVARLRGCADSLILIHNDRLLRGVGRDGEITEAFKISDQVVSQGILGIAELINYPKEVTVDFAQVRHTLGYRGGALMAVGTGRGSMGALEAARQALANPLLNLSITGARGVLLSITGGPNMSLRGVDAANEVIVQSVSEKAHTLLRVSVDQNLEDKVMLTLIATGL